MTIEPLRTIHVGARGRGAWPLHLMHADTRFQPVGVVTREPASIADTLAVAALPDASAHTSLSAALAAADCDIVVVCTPVELHARDLREAFAAGKHVLVEKCLSNRWDEACALVAEAERAAVELVVAQNSRYTASTQTLHAAVTSGEYGTAAVIDIAMHKYRPAPRQQDYPLAMFWDQGCHHVYDLQWCFGPITAVTARTFGAPWSRYRDDAAIQALCTFESGATCAYLLSNVSRGNELRFSVHTDRGVLTRHGDEWEWAAALAPDDAPFGWNAPPEPVAAPDLVPASGEHGVLDALYEAVTTRTPTPISGRANLETLRVCEMVERAALDGRTVTRAEVSAPRSQ
jgi:predicted dehydrogenase